MPKKNVPQKIEWTIPEFPMYERTAGWYVGASVIGLGLVTYAIYSANFLFALIIFMIALIVFLFGARTPETIPVIFDGRGMTIGAKTYTYSELHSFWISTTQTNDTRSVHILFKSSVKPRLSIPLATEDPSTVRDFLKQYMDEKLDREGEPLSDTIGRILKI